MHFSVFRAFCGLAADFRMKASRLIQSKGRFNIVQLGEEFYVIPHAATVDREDKCLEIRKIKY
jgi:hypothetical protein